MTRNRAAATHGAINPAASNIRQTCYPRLSNPKRIADSGSGTDQPGMGNAQMAETMARAQVLAAKRWMEDEAGMERASLSPAEYVAYRMKVSAADAEALVAAVYALEEEE
jgi:hypothetical protein